MIIVIICLIIIAAAAAPQALINTAQLVDFIADTFARVIGVSLCAGFFWYIYS